MSDFATISGSSSTKTYSQAVNFGDFLVVLSLTAGKNEPVLELGHHTLKKIEEIVSQTTTVPPKEVVAIITQELQNGLNLSLAVGKITSQKLSLTATGTIAAKLIRQGKIINLLPSSHQPPVTNYSSLSGPLRHHDLLIIATPDFFDQTKDNLINNLHLPPRELRDSLLPKIEAREDPSKVAALIVKIDLTRPPTESLNETPAPAVHPKSLIRNLITKHQSLITRLLPRRSLYLRPSPDPNAPPKRPYRKTFSAALIILVTLISLIAFQLRNRTLEQRLNTVAAMEKAVKEAQNSADKLASLNQTAARNILLQVKADFLAKAASSFGKDWASQKGADVKKLKSTLSELEQKIMTISKIYSLSSLEPFYDFSLLKADPVIAATALSKGEVVALDSQNGSLYSLSLKNKSAAIVAGSEEFKTATHLDFSGEKIFIFTAKNLLVANRASLPVSAKPAVLPSDKWGTIQSLKTFAGNLYLLDSGSNQIWKYQGTDFGFATVSAYLKASSVDFSQATDLAIDGYTYVLTATGNLARFAQGLPDDFKITNLDQPLENPRSLFVSDETENIYILDATPRVVVFDKKGSYKSQYLLPATNSLPLPATLLVDESLRKAFLVGSTKVFTFDLK